MAKINTFKDRKGNVIYQRPITMPNTQKAQNLLKKTVADKSQTVDYESPIDRSPRNYGRPVTNKPYFGLYDDEKSLSNVTLGDVTYKPLLSGYYGQKMNEAIGVNRLAGNTSMNTPQIAKYQGLAQKYEPTRFSNPNAPFGGMLNNAPQGAMSLIGQQVANLTDEDTVMYAGTGAAAGAMAGSVAGLPGSAITAATGFSAGITAGVGKNMYESVFGSTYKDLMDAGVSDGTAYKTALLSAGVQSALEMAQLDELAKAAKLLRKQNKTVLAEGIEKILIDRGKGVLKNTGEEVAQEAVAMGFEYDAKKLEGLPTDSWQDNVKRAGQTAIDSALSFGLMSVPGVVSAGRQISAYNKDNPMQKAVEIAKKTMNQQNQEVQTEQPQISQFTPDENVKNVLSSKFKSTEDVKKWAENIAQKSNFDIEFIADADKEYNGFYKPYAAGEGNGKQGRMVINLHSEDPVKTVLAHELTHILEANSKEYYEYANFAINNLVNRHYGTADITALAEQKAASYAQRGVNLSIDEAKQEIVADLTGQYLFKDEQSITDLYSYNENLFYRMYEKIKNMIKSFAGTDEEKDLIKARNLYAKVLKANQKNPAIAQEAAAQTDTQVAASYLFAGERAKNADKEALARAQQMEAESADAETIWKETGWFRGPDKKWRWEIDDSKGEYNSELANTSAEDNRASLQDYYKNTQLYDAYPDLKETGYEIDDAEKDSGLYDPKSNKVTVSGKYRSNGDNKGAEETTVHEIQHIVQEKEGFSKGGNSESALKLIRRSAKMNLVETGDEKFIDLMNNGTINQIEGYIDNVLMEMYNVDNIEDVGYKVYESLQGEVEARIASKRINMSSDERREKMPSFGNSLLLEELEDGKTFSKALSTQNKSTDNVPEIDNKTKPRYKESEKRTSGNTIAGSDEAAFSMQENSDEDVKFSLKNSDAKNIARKIKSDYGSKTTIKDISQELTEIYDMDVNDMVAVNQRIEQLAARIAENVPTVSEFEQRIKEFRNAVRNMPIRVDDNIKADIADYGAWSKRYFNRLNLKADGRNIDELYDSLAEQFPEFLETDITNPSDQLMAITEALDTTREDRGYSNNEDMMYDILLDIYDDYYRYQADEQAKAAEEPIFEPGDDGPGNNGPTDDGDAYEEYDGDTSLVRTDVWEHTEPEDRSPYFEKGENPARDINVPQRDEYGRKVSRFTRTAAESGALNDKQASELNESVWNGTFSYNVITDQDAINRANDKMERFDNDTLLNGLESKLYDSKIITKDDIALGERLIQEYAKEKNTENLERAIAVVATAGTRAGQAVQAMRLLKKLSPAGQLMALQKQIDVINTDMKLLGDNKVTLSPERASDITSSDTPEGLEQAVERAKMELYNKVPSRWVDKLNAWRYISMLGNPKTHIRNVIGNAIFVPARAMKNVVGATIEAATVKGERSKAIGPLPKIFKAFAAKEFDENKEAVDAGGKENIERNKKVYNIKLLENIRKANSFALEAEDQIFLKAAYVRSFAGYLKANKISPALVQKLMSGKGTDIEIGDAATAKIFNNARAYAMNEAQKATYRDYSALANALNKFKKTNIATHIIGERYMAFTKTPINILKRGVEYSPIGILKGIKELTNDARKADEDMRQQTILKGIDSMASGLSGTAILALGAFLASQGILSGGGEDDKKERDMDAMMGSQNYSFNIGDVSYTVDWTAPVSLPLFVGVELFNSLESGTVNGFVDIVDAMTAIPEPMINLSMLQGLNRAITNYDEDKALTDFLADGVLGYLGQYVPTFSGQVARTMDDTRRTAYVDKNNDIPDTLERPMLNAAAKVPGLSKKLNPYRDAFGREQKNDSPLMRAFENFISPGYIKVKKDDKVLDALQKVYEKTGDKGVLPSLPSKKVGEKNLNATEYDRMAYVKGDVAYRLVEDIIDTPVYREMDYTDKAKMISDAYDYAYAKAKDVVIGKAPDGWIAKAFEAAKDDINPETYIAYRSYKNSLPEDMYDSEKNRQTRELLFEDENLKTKDKNRLDDFLFNDGVYIPRDLKVDYTNEETFEITQTSEASQEKWGQVKRLGIDVDTYQEVYKIYYSKGIRKNQKIRMAIKAGLTPSQAYAMWDRLWRKKYN